jgi:hypothetical protein
MAIANLRPKLLEVETTLQHCAVNLSDTCVRRGRNSKRASNVLTWPCSSWNGHSPK